MNDFNAMTAHDTPPTLWTVKDIARILRCSERTVAALTASGELASLRIARLRRYRPEDVQAFIHRNLAGGR